MRYWLVMPAAGVGRRFGEHTPKQYADLHGLTVMEWALAPFLADSRCVAAVVVVGAADPHWPRIAARLPQVNVAVGGAERSVSVRNGLAALKGRAAADEWVLVHDAARPCICGEDLDRLLDSAHLHPVGGLLAAPAADTLKRARDDQQIVETVDRAGLWRALTPQMFRYGRLCEALDSAIAAGRVPTDEAQAFEWQGQMPVVVQGSSANIKVTTADDLLIAAALLGARMGTRAAGERSK
ncbi:MAG: 2-C-methyl-D-erythritol 4-phosphate cytidylyltransferase [Steroidobacteraceae bacterium]